MTNISSTVQIQNTVEIPIIFNSSNVPCRASSEWYYAYLGGIIAPLFCVFGLFGNSICIFVLSRPSMRSSSVNVILLILAISDLVQELMTLLMRGFMRLFMSFCIFQYYTHYWQPQWVNCIFALSTIAQTSSIYLTVLVSGERYFAVKHPFRARAWFSPKKSGMLSVAIIFFSFLYNIPTWFELKATPKFSKTDPPEFLYYDIDRTKLYSDPNYIFYYVNIGSFVFLRLIPFSMLVVLNFMIYRAIREMNRARATLTQFQAHEVKVARMLFCVVLLFIASNLITVVSHMVEGFSGKKPPRVLSSFSNLFVLLSPTFNCLIYSFMSKKFREVLFDSFNRRRNSGKTLASSHSSATVVVFNKN